MHIIFRPKWMFSRLWRNVTVKCVCGFSVFSFALFACIFADTYWKQIYALRMKSVIISLSFFFSLSLHSANFFCCFARICGWFFCFFLSSAVCWSMYHFNFYIWIWIGKNIIIITYKLYALRSIITPTSTCIHLELQQLELCWALRRPAMLFLSNEKCVFPKIFQKIYRKSVFDDWKPIPWYLLPLVDSQMCNMKYESTYLHDAPCYSFACDMLFIVPPITFRLSFQ